MNEFSEAEFSEDLELQEQVLWEIERENQMWGDEE
jgi:hypothetical protein